MLVGFMSVKKTVIWEDGLQLGKCLEANLQYIFLTGDCVRGPSLVWAVAPVGWWSRVL